MDKLQDTSVGSEFLIEVDGKYILKHTQTGSSIESVLHQNKIDRDTGNNGYGKTRELRKIASIPVLMDYEFVKKYGHGYHKDPVILKRILAEHPLFRTY
jgi:hypothetical protein